MKHYLNILSVAAIFIIAVVFMTYFFYEYDDGLTDVQREIKEYQEFETSTRDQLNYENARMLNNPDYCNLINDQRLQRSCLRNFE